MSQRDLDEPERKRQGPIGWLIGTYRQDPYFANLIIFTAFLLFLVVAIPAFVLLSGDF